MYGPKQITAGKKKREKFATYSTPDPEYKGVFFRDGQRRVDFVLVFKHDGSLDDGNEDSNADASAAAQMKTVEGQQQAAAWRDTFHENLLNENLHLEIEQCSASETVGNLAFVKVHASWKALSKYAEVLRIRMPIEFVGDSSESAALATSLEEGQQFGCCLDPLGIDYDHEAIPDTADYFSAPFTRPYAHLFRLTDKETFFNPAQRSRITWYILSNVAFGTHALESGIHRLLSKSVYTAAYPLHDGLASIYHAKPISISSDGAVEKQRPPDRYLLYYNWASFRHLFRKQPLDTIRDYFGEKLGMYFAWMGDYTRAMFYLAILGLSISVYGAVTLNDDENVKQVCNPERLGCAIMCPLCDKGCGYWVLRNSCLMASFSYLVDNLSTIAYAIIIAIWAVVFLEMWRRREWELQYRWDIYDFEEREPPRPQYEAKASATRIDPLTGQEEPYEPTCWRVVRGLASWSLVFVLIAVVFGTMLSVVIYRTVLNAKVFTSNQSPFIENNGRLMISFSASLISLVVILVLTRFYEWLAYRLTDWERPRTQSDFDDSLTIKLFIFQFANCYGTIFYIAFIRGRYLSFMDQKSLPAGMSNFLDYVSEQCDPAGCMTDLAIQLAIVMVGRQISSHLIQLFVPYLMRRRHQLRGLFNKQSHDKSTGNDNNNNNKAKPPSKSSVTPMDTELQNIPRWEADYHLVDYTNSGVLHEYLEMAIQFGFVTLFGVCFPLSPIFAFINNVIEIRMDAYKLIRNYRRPVAALADGVGIWLEIMTVLIWISIVSNAMIIAFTSQNINKMAYQLAGEHLDQFIENAPSLNDTTMTRYNMSYFTYTMSVLEVNSSLDKPFHPESQCLNLDFADPIHAGGFNLQSMAAADNGSIGYCYFRGLYQPPWGSYPYEYRGQYYHLLAVRLSFALTFIVLVWVLAWVLARAIPRRSKNVRILQRHEQQIHEHALLMATTEEEAVDDDDEAPKRIDPFKALNKEVVKQ